MSKLAQFFRRTLSLSIAALILNLGIAEPSVFNSVMGITIRKSNFEPMPNTVTDPADSSTELIGTVTEHTARAKSQTLTNEPAGALKKKDKRVRFDQEQLEEFEDMRLLKQYCRNQAFLKAERLIETADGVQEKTNSSVWLDADSGPLSESESVPQTEIKRNLLVFDWSETLFPSTAINVLIEEAVDPTKIGFLDSKTVLTIFKTVIDPVLRTIIAILRRAMQNRNNLVVILSGEKVGSIKKQLDGISRWRETLLYSSEDAKNSAEDAISKQSQDSHSDMDLVDEALESQLEKMLSFQFSEQLFSEDLDGSPKILWHESGPHDDNVGYQLLSGNVLQGVQFLGKGLNQNIVQRKRIPVFELPQSLRSLAFSESAAATFKTRLLELFQKKGIWIKDSVKVIIPSKLSAQALQQKQQKFTRHAWQGLQRLRAIVSTKTSASSLELEGLRRLHFSNIVGIGGDKLSEGSSIMETCPECVSLENRQFLEIGWKEKGETLRESFFKSAAPKSSTKSYCDTINNILCSSMTSPINLNSDADGVSEDQFKSQLDLPALQFHASGFFRNSLLPIYLSEYVMGSSCAVPFGFKSKQTMVELSKELSELAEGLVPLKKKAFDDEPEADVNLNGGESDFDYDYHRWWSPHEWGRFNDTWSPDEWRRAHSTWSRPAMTSANGGDQDVVTVTGSAKGDDDIVSVKNSNFKSNFNQKEARNAGVDSDSCCFSTVDKILKLNLYRNPNPIGAGCKRLANNFHRKMMNIDRFLMTIS